LLEESQTDKAIINEIRGQLKQCLILIIYHKYYYKATQGGPPKFGLVDDIFFINYENK